MNTAEHTFPLPEEAVHALDEVEETLEVSWADYFRSHIYESLAVCAVAGCVLGWALRRRR